MSQPSREPARAAAHGAKVMWLRETFKGILAHCASGPTQSRFVTVNSVQSVELAVAGAAVLFQHS